MLECLPLVINPSSPCLFLFSSVQCIFLKYAPLVQHYVSWKYFLSQYSSYLWFRIVSTQLRNYYVYISYNTDVKWFSLSVIFLLALLSSFASCLWRSSWLPWLPTRSKLVHRRWVSVAALFARAGMPEAWATPARPLPRCLVERASCLAGTTVQCLCVPRNMWRTGCPGHESSNSQQNTVLNYR